MALNCYILDLKFPFVEKESERGHRSTSGAIHRRHSPNSTTRHNPHTLKHTTRRRACGPQSYHLGIKKKRAGRPAARPGGVPPFSAVHSGDMLYGKTTTYRPSKFLFFVFFLLVVAQLLGPLESLPLSSWLSAAVSTAKSVAPPRESCCHYVGRLLLLLRLLWVLHSILSYTYEYVGCCS